jgi:23S rRNA pseudouridine1911/1915/1917 synthase
MLKKTAWEVLMAELSFLIAPEEAGATVNTVLRRGHGCSGTLLKNARAGLRLDGVSVPLSAMVEAGQLLTLPLPEDPEDDLAPLPYPLDIAFEDDYLLIVNKPPKVTVHPTSGHHTGTLAAFVKAHYQSRGEHHTFRAVNRLDRGTSGLMVIAKDSYTHQQLTAQLHTPAFQRRYLALCQSTPVPPQGVVDAPIGRLPGEVLRRGVLPEGKRAVTHYRVLASAPKGGALVELMLDTGRTHQIRVHMTHLGCPLVGDFLYGTECPQLIGRTALHACALSLRHPVTGAALSFQAPLPEDMGRAAERMGLPIK